MARINIEITENELRQLVVDRLRDTLGNAVLTESDVVVEVKSDQNYKSEWEKASFRVRYSGEI